MVEVWASLTQRYLDELIPSPPGSLTAMAAHAKLASLNEIRKDLESIVNDDRVFKAAVNRRKIEFNG